MKTNEEIRASKEYVDAFTLEKMFGVAVESFPSFFDADLNVSDNFFATLFGESRNWYSDNTPIISWI